MDSATFASFFLSVNDMKLQDDSETRNKLAAFVSETRVLVILLVEENCGVRGNICRSRQNTNRMLRNCLQSAQQDLDAQIDI